MGRLLKAHKCTERGNTQCSSVPSGGQAPVSAPAAPVAKPNDVIPTPVQDASPQALAALQTSSQELLAKLVKELDPQAHFVSYAS